MSVMFYTQAHRFIPFNCMIKCDAQVINQQSKRIAKLRKILRIQIIMQFFIFKFKIYIQIFKRKSRLCYVVHTCLDIFTYFKYISYEALFTELFNLTDNIKMETNSLHKFQIMRKEFFFHNRLNVAFRITLICFVQFFFTQKF